nr:ROK family protein [Propionibacterium sp.]
MTLAVGVDVGGTKTAAALVDAAGTVGPVVTVPTPAAAGGAAVLDAIAGLVRRVADGRPIVGVGVGTAGVVDAGRGVIVSSTDTFVDWIGTDVAAGLRARLGVERVEVRNDVDAHALGEAWLGAGAGAASLLMVAVGTGVGGALVLDGRLRTGAHHVAGELGHIPAVGAEGLRCPCGRPGHLEALAAGPGLARRYGVLAGVEMDAREVARRAAAGDATATRAIADAAACLGRAVAGIMTVVDPEVVVIGGGVPGIGALWWGPMEAACRAETIDALAGVPIVPAVLGAEAALLGAASTVLLSQDDKE